MNDANPEAIAPDPNQGNEGSISLAGELLNKHGGSQGQGQGAPNGGTAGPPVGGSSLDPSLVAKAVQGAVKALDGVLCRRLGNSAHRLTGDTAFARNIVEETRLTPEESEQIGNLSAMLAQKYALAASFAPEIALGVIVIGYGARFQFAMRRLDELTKAGVQPKAQNVTAMPKAEAS